MRLPPLLTATAALIIVTAVHGQTAPPTLYIEPATGGFEADLRAAMTKKKVPVRVVTTTDGAEYRLKIAIVETQTVPTGSTVAADPVNCCGDSSHGSSPWVFSSGSGAEKLVQTSAQLVDAAGAVVWSHSVSKGLGSSRNRRSVAEAIATRLRDDFLKKHPAR